MTAPELGKSAGEPLLEVADIVVGYGRIEALHGISLQVAEGNW